MFLSELVYNAYRSIEPNLKQDRTILQDRYDISVSSFVPNTKRFYNQLLIKAARFLIPQPDAIVYFSLPVEESEGSYTNKIP